MTPPGVNAALAFAAGLLSFFSPCVLPLVPVYLSLLGGASPDGQQIVGGRARALFRTLAFVLGFSVVFVALGAVFSSALGALGRLTSLVNVIAGGVVVLLGANVIFDFWKLLDLERRLHLERRPGGLAGAAVMGMAFAAGWVPCVGPVLGSILLLAGTSGTVWQGVVLLLVYSLGLGMPLVLAGLFLSSARRAVRALRPAMPAIRIASGIFVVGLGILIALGRLGRLSLALYSAARVLAAWRGSHPLQARVLPAALLGLAAVLAGWLGSRRAGTERLRPAAIAAAVLCAGLAVLVACRVLDPLSLLAAWLAYQGI